MDRVLRATLPDGTFRDVSPARSLAMAKIRGKGNKSTECRLRFSLVNAGIEGWQMHPKNISGRPDFFFSKKRLAIFVDGCFWHGCNKCGHVPKTNSLFWKTKLVRNRRRDRKYTQLLKEQGILVIRFWEHELRNTLRTCVEKVLTAMGETTRRHRALMPPKSEVRRNRRSS